MSEDRPPYKARTPDRLILTESDRVHRIPLSEEQFVEQIVAMAQLTGWLVHHDRPARTEKGWRTSIQGNAGFPDLVLCRPPVVLFLELKSEKGRVTAGQAEWLRFLSLCPGIQSHIFTPTDWPEIEAMLKKPYLEEING